MQFAETDDRRMLRDTLQRFLSEAKGQHRPIGNGADGPGFCTETYAALVELGVVGALFTEDHGGLGGAAHDIALVFEELGRSNIPTPCFANLYAGHLVAELGTESQTAVINQVISGEIQLAFAHSEPGARYNLSYVTTQAHSSCDGYVLNGYKAVVLNGGAADMMVVSARTSGGAADQAGISLFVVPVDSAGLNSRSYATIDGAQAVDVNLHGVELSRDALLGPENTAFEALECVTALATLAVTASSLGAMDRAKDMTVDYLRTRKQFGRPLGQFQALQHRMVDVLMAVEQARSAVLNLIESADAPCLIRERNVSATKNLVGRSSRLVVEECIQMHGGIGMTDEYALAHFARSLVASDHLLGDTDYHLARFIELNAT